MSEKEKDEKKEEKKEVKKVEKKVEYIEYEVLYEFRNKSIILYDNRAKVLKGNNKQLTQAGFDKLPDAMRFFAGLDANQFDVIFWESGLFDGEDLKSQPHRVANAQRAILKTITKYIEKL